MFIARGHHPASAPEERDVYSSELPSGRALRRSAMFIARSHYPASAPQERNVNRKPTCRSYGARVLPHTSVYKHLAPPEQRQWSAKLILLSLAAFPPFRRFHK
jgi:hypothetical protein